LTGLRLNSRTWPPDESVGRWLSGDMAVPSCVSGFDRVEPSLV
jgi:hypothetical protein